MRLEGEGVIVDDSVAWSPSDDIDGRGETGRYEGPE